MKVGTLASLAFCFTISGYAQLTGLPYSATQVTQQTQTLADGTHIAQPEHKTMMYRDSAGRTRTEFAPISLRPGMATAQPLATTVTIMDPVAGYHYMLDSRTKVARRTAVNFGRGTGGNGVGIGAGNGGAGIGVGIVAGTAGALSATPLPPPPPPYANRVQSKSESLGTQMIEGLLCDGHRFTVTTPAGAIGNDRDMVAVTENWTSQELKLTVLSRRSDPRSGESITKLTDISRAQPDPALFMVPLDYTVEDQPVPQKR